MKDGYQSDPDVSDVETKVEEVWRDVLGMRDGQEESTFFDLQGQSIAAVRIVARIEDELGLSVDVGLLFEDPDLESFTRAVVAAAGYATTHEQG